MSGLDAYVDDDHTGELMALEVTLQASEDGELGLYGTFGLFGIWLLQQILLDVVLELALRIVAEPARR